MGTLGRRLSSCHSVGDLAPFPRRLPLTPGADGGGVRGYSTLLILRELMSIVGRLEVDNLPPADCSLHPRDYVLPKGSHPHLGSDSFRYLPCHYFDYMAGTSTGGYASCECHGRHVHAVWLLQINCHHAQPLAHDGRRLSDRVRDLWRDGLRPFTLVVGTGSSTGVPRQIQLATDC